MFRVQSLLESQGTGKPAGIAQRKTAGAEANASLLARARGRGVPVSKRGRSSSGMAIADSFASRI